MSMSHTLPNNNDENKQDGVTPAGDHGGPIIIHGEPSEIIDTVYDEEYLKRVNKSTAPDSDSDSGYDSSDCDFGSTSEDIETEEFDRRYKAAKQLSHTTIINDSLKMIVALHETKDTQELAIQAFNTVRQDAYEIRKLKKHIKKDQKTIQQQADRIQELELRLNEAKAEEKQLHQNGDVLTEALAASKVQIEHLASTVSSTKEILEISDNANSSSSSFLGFFSSDNSQDVVKSLQELYKGSTKKPL